MLKPNLSGYYSYLGRLQEVGCGDWKSCCVMLLALALFCYVADTVGEVVESVFFVGFTTAEQGFQKFKVTSES
jgi:hypothetical protein